MMMVMILVIRYDNDNVDDDLNLAHERTHLQDLVIMIFMMRYDDENDVCDEI